MKIKINGIEIEMDIESFNEFINSQKYLEANLRKPDLPVSDNSYRMVDRQSSDIYQKILDLYSQGIPLRKISKKLNITDNIVRYCIYNRNRKYMRSGNLSINRKHTKWTQNEIDFLYFEKLKQTPVKVLAKRLGRTRSAIKTMISLIQHGKIQVNKNSIPQIALQ